jgi:hypothetical protein
VDAVISTVGLPLNSPEDTVQSSAFFKLDDIDHSIRIFTKMFRL